jgi:hypothetical protein
MKRAKKRVHTKRPNTYLENNKRIVVLGLTAIMILLGVLIINSRAQNAPVEAAPNGYQNSSVAQ